MTDKTPSNGDAVIQNGGQADNNIRDENDDEDSSNYDSCSDDEADQTEVSVPWTCRKCNLLYDDGELQNWISCAICVANFDTACLKMSNRTYKVLTKNPNAFWLCDHCKKNYMPNQDRGLDLVKHKMKNLGEKIQTLSKTANHLASLQEELKSAYEEIGSQLKTSFKSMESNLSKELDKMKTEVPQEAIKKWSDLAKSSPTPQESVTIQNVKTAIQEVTAMDKEMEIRSRGIVIYRAPESKETTSEERKNADARIISDLLTHIKCDDTQVKSFDRLGRFDSDRDTRGKHRPIKVRFSTNTERDKVLKNLFRLRDAEPPLKTLSIRQDLNDKQREELSKKLSEAYELSKNSETLIYRVRGGPGDYKIKEFPRRPPNEEENNKPESLNG